MLPLVGLGKTDLQISRVGLGTVKFGRNQDVKYPEAFELPSNKKARELLNLARDLGVNLLDTAPAYGTSEERLGELLQGERKHWIICTKAGETFHGYESRFDFSATALRKSLDRSLRHLRTDYIDILLIHSDGNDMDIIQRDQALHTLSQFKRDGWIRAFGMSTKTTEGGLACTQAADLIMTTYDPEIAQDVRLMDECCQYDCGVILKKIFKSGHLLIPAQEPAKAEQHTTQTLIDAQMQAIFTHKAVKSAIIGTLNPNHLRNNVASAMNALLG
jgi:aryl-alcohol dehydrogenase-like predicted oxidoreductase